MRRLFLLLLLPALASAACEVLPVNSPCRCEFHNNRQIINCRREGLTEVPLFNEVSQVYDELTLAANDITILRDEDFKVLNIKLLDLTGNPINVIESNAFTGLNEHLEELILTVNNLPASSFPTQALSELTDLQILRMEDFNMASLPDNAVSQLTSLVELHMQSCGLQELTDEDVRGQQDSLQVLDLNDNRLSGIPSGAIRSLRSLTQLFLTGNEVTQLLDDGLNGVQQLQELDLSQNSITIIQEDAFNGLQDTLQTLRMHHCGLMKQQLTPMNDLRQLVTLDLAHNSVSGIPVGFFAAMSRLQVLNFEANEISVISSTTFDGLSNSLMDLDLEGNNIGNIEANSFAGLDMLKTLILSFQSQSLAGELDANTFTGLENTLETLGLASVGFTDGNWVSVTGLWNLRSLDLQSNSISDVPDFNFLQMTMLDTLKLTTNQITTVTQRGMHGPEQTLRVVELGSNQVEVIDHCVFKDFERMEKIDLHDNPLRCDCQLQWLRLWTEGLSPAEQDGIQWQCASPAHHAGSKFMDVNVEDFTCDDGEELPQCEDFTPSTTSTSTPSTTTTQPVLQPLYVWVDNTTDSVVHVSWTFSSTHDIDGFSIYYFVLGIEEDVEYLDAHEHARTYYIKDLEPATSYYVCVAAVYTHLNQDNHYTCVDARTIGAVPVTEGSSSTAVIVAAVLGAVFVVAILLLVIFFCRRCRKDSDDDGGFMMSRGDMPQLGYNSKRFSRARSAGHDNVQNFNNEKLENKLEGFSQEERDRIIKLFSRSGASTLSMISQAESQRYVPEPPSLRPEGADGYMNPVDLKDEEFYYEIPDDDENYDEIPADHVGVGKAAGSVYI